MKPWLQHVLTAFIPLLVATDLLGLIPFFLGLTQGLSPDYVKKTTYQAILTAAIVSIGFVLLGKLIFRFLGITVPDFQIAGGLILLALTLRELVGAFNVSQPKEDFGVVPLGMPLIAGPGLITTLLLMIDTVGIWSTLVALILNLAIVGASLYYAGRIAKRIGTSGLKAMSKITALLLAAIAVRLIRQGFHNM